MGKFSTRQKRWLLAFGLALFAYYFLVHLGLIPKLFPICEKEHYFYYEKCPEYDALSYVLWTIVSFLDRHNGSILAAATVAIAYFTYILSEANIRQTELTKEVMVADRRAFAFADNLSIVPENDDLTGRVNWRFQIQWMNSGETPTKKIRLYNTVELRSTPLDPGFDFTKTRVSPGTGLIPPKSTKLSGIAPHIDEAAITPDDIENIQAGRLCLYIWGWARYFDVFPGTAEHITRYCWRIFPIGNAFLDPSNLSFASQHHTEGNCADDECAQ